ncbi:MAG TPA: FtsX-like permease family protein [Pyrinomonadaceae bacterium]|jgi:putative ABC transport system permease protein|nr:FtsX-like permease family protein [Pyrinomonadaceae bacterium]
MARREMRSSWRRLLFFFLCIGIGVGSIVALRSTIQNINRTVAGEARALLTADVQVDSTRPWKTETLQTIERLARPGVVEARTETIEANTMVRPADTAREGAMMVELKGIEPPYPLYGDFKLTGGRAFDHALLADGGAVVAPLLMERLNLRVGDRVKIGESTFEIRGQFDYEPGSGGGFRLGPRVFVARSAIEATGLTGFGSRARRRILFKVREGELEGFVRTLRGELKGQLVTVNSYKDSQENLSEQFTRTENYLSLTGLIVLVLGGIGVSSVTRVFIEQKKQTIAVLKCIGGTGRQITAAYLAQVISLGLLGSLLGVALARGALLLVAHYFTQALPPGMSYGLTRGAIAQGLGLGVLVSILFSALPLLRIRRIKPNMLLRDEEGDVVDGRGRRRRRRPDALRLLTGALVVLGLVFLSSWQAGSIRVGLIFLSGLAVTAALLYGAAFLLVLLVRRARNIRSFALRQAVSSLHRPGNQTRVIIMAVGLGAFVVMAIQSLQTNLLNEIDISRRAQLPNMFLIDIQTDQKQGVENLIEGATGVRPELIPTVRARIYAIDGREIDLEQREMREQRGRLGREYVVTYRPRLESNETLVAGRFWDATPSTEPEVSIEEGMRGLAGLDLGSNITFDIVGRKLTARVTSIRRVDWRNSRTGFMVLFRPGVLESAPQMLIAPINGPESEPARSRFQRALLDQYPNISVIDVAEVVSTISRILNNVTLAVSFLGGFVLLCGVLILVGSIAMTKYQRIYEVAVLKTLGAKRKVLLVILFVEYGLLGLVAGIVGALAALALSYAVTRFIFEIPWDFSLTVILAGIAATIALVTIVGVTSSFNVLTRKPLAILRAQ